MGLYDVQGAIPVVKNVFIPPDADGTLPIELEDVMPLLQFLAPVCLSHTFISCDFFFLNSALALMKPNGKEEFVCVTKTYFQ